MDDPAIKDILSGLSWKGKPVFPVASKENKKLEDELLEKKEKIQSLRSHIDDQESRMKLMKEHYHDVEQELGYTQRLQEARQHELETEEHLHKLFERERSRLVQEMQEFQKDLSQLEERQALYEKTFREQIQKRDTLKANIHWDQQALEAWLEESVKNEEDRLALMKYTHQDDSKVKELRLQLERLGQEAVQRKSALDHAYTDVFAAEAEMDRIEEDFRRAHQERQDIISDWEKVIMQIEKRHEEMRSLAEKLHEMKNEEASLRENLEEKHQFLMREEQNNKELKLKLNSAEALSATLRKESTSTLDKERTLIVELDALKALASYTAFQLRSAQAVVSQLNDEINDKNNRLKNLDDEKTNLENQFNDLTKMTLSAEARTQQMDKLLLQEENNLKQLQNENKKLLEIHTKNNQKLKEIIEREKNLTSEVKGAESASRNLSGRIQRADNDRFHQQAMMYNVDFEIEQMEQRIRRMAGESNDDEQRQLEAEIGELTAVLEQKNAAYNFLVQQVRITEEKINNSRRMLEKNKVENEELMHKLESLELYINNAQRILKTTTDRKEGYMVDECLIKLQLKRFQELLTQRADTVFSLQKHQLEFEMAMKERQQEIFSCKEMLQAEFRIEEQDRQKLHQQLQEWSSKAEKLQTKYKVIMCALGVAEAGDSTHSDMLMKAEDEKRELQRQAEELRSEIAKCEQELRALHNSFQLVRATNINYRQSLNPPGVEDVDYDRLQNLEEEQHRLSVEFFEKEQQLNAVNNNLQIKKETHDELENQIASLQSLNFEKHEKEENILKELLEQQEKLLRASRQNSRLNVEIRNAENVHCPEDDIMIRIRRDIRKQAAKLIANAVADSAYQTERVQSMFAEAHLPPLPSPGSTPSSSRSGSRSSLPSSATNLRRKSSHADSASIKDTIRTARTTSTPSTQTVSRVSIGSDFPIVQSGHSRRSSDTSQNKTS